MKSIQLMTNKNIITIFLLLINSFFFGQINECDNQVPSSIEKLYLKGKNYKKYDYKNRLKFLKDAIEIEEENIPFSSKNHVFIPYDLVLLKYSYFSLT